MTINFKDIKQAFFIDYLKYWIIFFLILVIYFLNNQRKYLFETNKITMDIERAIYVSNGVAINNKYVLTNKSLVDKSCIGALTKRKGRFYIITKDFIMPAVISYSDAISNMVLLKLSNNRDIFKYVYSCPS